MAIENRNLEPGIKLIARYKGNTYHGLVTDGEDRKVRYQLVPYDDREYKSLSSLGTAVTGKPCNGWAFWSIDSSETQPTETASTKPETPATEETTEAEAPASEVVEPTYVPLDEAEAEPPISLGFRRVPNQRGVDPGQVRLYCDACRSSFIVPQGQNPTECPMGHRPD